jgi:glycosyltransferase involved in cell wall biosynthesis
MLKILFLEPFYGGSHREFADGLVRHSRHAITLATLPARFWKWRMRGAALWFLETAGDMTGYDLIFVSGLMSLADLKALSPAPLPPTAVYFHESQLSYPLAPGEKMDYQFGFTDITTGLAADALIFNSHYHYTQFFSELPRFLRRMPDSRPTRAAGLLKEKSLVIHPGFELSTPAAQGEHPESSAAVPSAASSACGPPILLWNHRWEFDKNPQCFFRVLAALDDEGIPFRLALLGENYSRVPDCFPAARERYGDRILVYGYRESRAEYASWLGKSRIVVSCAVQENFGLSVVEAAAAGAYPLLPARLAYPEVIPEAFHARHLYRDEQELHDMLAGLLTEGIPGHTALRRALEIHDWGRRITEYDDFFEQVAGKRP